VLFDYPSLVAFMTISAIDNKLEPGKLYLVGMSGGVGKVVPNPALYNALPADVRSKVGALTESIKSGTFKVPMMVKPNESEGFDVAKLNAK
jgi:basic membrane lipoprotein Med (substrate-binding protein (PBP1-ABC) superfamily)